MGKWYKKIDDYLDIKQKEINKISRYLKYRPELRLPESFQYKTESKSYVYNGSATLKEIFSSLQYYAHFNRHPFETADPVSITLDIMEQPFTFILCENKIGSDKGRGKQILIMVQGRSGKIMYRYKGIMTILEGYRSPAALANAMLDALGKKQDEQRSHEIGPDVICAAAKFLLLTHIAESAIPFPDTIKEFRKIVKKNLKRVKKNLDLGDSVKKDSIEKKTGRIPMADKIVRSKLRNISEGNISFAEAFSEKNFPIRSEDGTSKGREWVLHDINGSSTGDLSDTDIEDDHNNGEEENDSERAIKQGSDGIEDIVVEAESRDEKFLDVEDDQNNDEEEENSERAIKQGSDGKDEKCSNNSERAIKQNSDGKDEKCSNSERAIKQGSDGKDEKCSDVEELVAPTAKMAMK